MTKTAPIQVTHLFPKLNDQLITLLRSLTPDQWETQTIARQWKVKDVAAHLLDTNIRSLSILRDSHFGERPDIRSDGELVDFLNRLNADWVKAMKRVSPEMLVLLHEVTGRVYCDYLASLDPFGRSALPVAWAGEAESFNWMNIAREYTEKWLHQQQIRDALELPGLMSREFFYPFIDIFMYGLPVAYRATPAAENTAVQVSVSTDIGGNWFVIRKKGRWELSKQLSQDPGAVVIIDPEIAWKLFSKSMRPGEITDGITVKGDDRLGKIALTMVSVMA